MTATELLNQIRQEIKRRIKEYDAIIESQTDAQRAERDAWKWAECKSLLSFLDTIQVDEPEGLDEAAEKYENERLSDYGYRGEIAGAFEAGAEWQKAQMMKDAVDGKVFMSFAPSHNQMVMADVDLPTNTKVKLIIVKEG